MLSWKIITIAKTYPYVVIRGQNVLAIIRSDFKSTETGFLFNDSTENELNEGVRVSFRAGTLASISTDGTRVIKPFSWSGSGCGSVDRTVTSNVKGPGFKSTHWHILLNIYLLSLYCTYTLKTKIKWKIKVTLAWY